MNFFSKILFHDLDNFSSCYIFLSPDNLKIEVFVDEQGRKRLRLFLNLDTKIKIQINPDPIFNIRIRKEFKEGQLVPRYIFDPSFNSVLEEYLMPRISLIQQNREDDEPSWFTTMDEIIKQNSDLEDSSKTKTHWTIPTLIYNPSEENILRFFENPTDDIMANLTSLESSIPQIYSYIRNLEPQRVEMQVNSIFDKYGIDEDLREEIKNKLKINSFMSKNERRILTNSGAILLGPFGSGKSFIANTILKEIFTKVFGCGFESINMAERTGGSDSKYINAGTRAVNDVFMPVIKQIQTKKKPFLLFIDEGDIFVKSPSGDSGEDSKIIPAVKNLLNPRTYPGLIVCINTNLESDDLDPGVKERRLQIIQVNFPKKETQISIWKIQEEMLQHKFQEFELECLGELGSELVGVDGIETFSNNEVTSILRNGFNFLDFFTKYYRYARHRVIELTSSEIKKLENKPYVNQQQVVRMRNETQQRVEELDRRYNSILEKINNTSFNQPDPQEQSNDNSDFLKPSKSKHDKLYIILGIPTSIKSGVVENQKIKANYLISKGHNVLIINHWWDLYRYKDLSRNKFVKVSFSPYNYFFYSSGNLMEKGSLKLWINMVSYIKKLSFENNYVFLETHTFYEKKQINSLRSTIPNIKIIYTIHQLICYFRATPEIRNRINSPNQLSKNELSKIRNSYSSYRERLQEELFEQSDFIITISPTIKNACEKIYPEISHKVKCIENSIDVIIENEEVLEEETKILKQKLGIPVNNIVFGYIGRLEVVKLGQYKQEWPPRVIEFLNKILNSTNNVSFLFIGIDDSFKNTLVNKWGVDPKVLHKVFTSQGWINDTELKIKMINILDCLVQPVSSKDLYGRAVIEALLLKKLVMSCPGELSLVDCSNIDTMISIAMRISNGEKFEDHLSKSYEVALHRFGINNNMLKYLELFENDLIKESTNSDELNIYNWQKKLEEIIREVNNLNSYAEISDTLKNKIFGILFFIEQNIEELTKPKSKEISPEEVSTKVKMIKNMANLFYQIVNPHTQNISIDKNEVFKNIKIFLNSIQDGTFFQ